MKQIKTKTLEDRIWNFLFGPWIETHSEYDEVEAIAKFVREEQRELLEALKGIVRIRPKGLCIQQKEASFQEHYPESCIWCKAEAAIAKAEEKAG